MAQITLLQDDGTLARVDHPGDDSVCAVKGVHVPAGDFAMSERLLFCVARPSTGRPTKEQMRAWWQAAEANGVALPGMRRINVSVAAREHVEFVLAENSYTVYRDGLPVWRQDAHGVCRDEATLADSAGN